MIRDQRWVLEVSARRRRLLAGGALACVCLFPVVSPVSAGADPLISPAVTAAASLAGRVTPATLGLGGGFADAATLTVAPGGPAPTGTISFSVYGPTDPGCTGPVVFNSTNTLVVPSTVSSSFTPPNLGTYEVIARYGGDSNYGSVSSACGDPSQVVSVGRRPTLTTISPRSGPAGGQNTVTITGTDLAGATIVNFGAAATPATVIDSTEVIAPAPAPAGSGPVDVTVTTPFGTTATLPADVYTYAAATTQTVLGPTTSFPGQPPLSQTGATTKITASTARLTGIVDPRGLGGSAQFEYTVRLSGGGSVTGRTPEQTIGLHPATVIADVTGLLANSRYRVRLIASSPAGVTVGGATSFVTARSPRPGRPVLAKTFNAAPISGLVYVRLPGAGQAVTPLTDARQLPVGTTLDTRRGAVRLTTAATGADRSGSFAGGTFRLSQTRARGGLTELQLVRASTSRKICAAAAGRARPSTPLGLVRATATAGFEVHARYGSATGSRATWTTTDRCDGLSASVTRGTVEVDDLGRRRTVAVFAGHTYLAKAP
jgi:hypothetical protein